MRQGNETVPPADDSKSGEENQADRSDRGTVRSLGMRRQLEVYRGRFFLRRPLQPVSLEELQRKAKQILSRDAYDYLAGGAGSEDTMRANREAFRRRPIVPRVLRDIENRDLTCEVLGTRLPAPFLLAPIGVLGILHKQGDLAVARAAASLDVPMVCSTVSSYALEEVAEAMGDSPRWFQLYWGTDDEFTASLLRRAERAGYSAIVVTLDTKLLAWRERDIQNAYLPFVWGKGLANYFSDPLFIKALPGPPRRHRRAAVEHFARIFSKTSLNWDDLGFLREHTRLPVVLKGILSADDARKAVDHGADALVVSNHGGRQMDGAIAALDALPGVVEAVGGRIPVLFDSGVRRGSDLFKAVALGARAVLLGRPYAFGLAVRGEAGVRDVLGNFMADVDLTLGLAGCRSFAEVRKECLVLGP